MCSVYERAFFMLFGQLGMLFEFIFFLIILIRNPLEYMDGIISFFIGIVRFWGPPTSDLSSIVLDGKWIKRLLFSCDNFFFYSWSHAFFFIVVSWGTHKFFLLFFFFVLDHLSEWSILCNKIRLNRIRCYIQDLLIKPLKFLVTRNEKWSKKKSRHLER